MDERNTHAVVLRFLRKVHRWHVWVRVTEASGWGLIVGFILALGALGLAWAMGRPPTAPISVSLLICGMAGGMTGWLRRPSLLDSAIEVDQQLNLHDLLSTAWASRSHAPDPWIQSMFAIAEARCVQLRTSQVTLHRWGIRAWGGVGLGTALLLAMVLIIPRSTPSFAAQQAVGVFDPTVISPIDPVSHSSIANPSETVKPPQSGNPDPQTSDSVISTSVQIPSSETLHTPRAKGLNGQGKNGSGQAQTDALPQALSMNLSAIHSQSQPVDHAPTAAGGAGDTERGTEHTKTGGFASSGGLGSSRSEMPLDRTSRLPDGSFSFQPADEPYRDLIRDYFDRD